LFPPTLIAALVRAGLLPLTSTLLVL